ncbi:MAG: hypothetical protein ACREND_08605, partial [Gemmatimonadaceae bacterium]
SYVNLVHALYFDGDSASTVRAAQAALPFARNVNPATDTVALDKLARIYHYGGLAYSQMRRGDDAARWFTNGMAVVAAGEKRHDQVKSGLQYTESQLWLDMAEVDSTRHDTTDGLTDMRKAMDAARRRYNDDQTFSNHAWLARVTGWSTGYALALHRYDYAVTLTDSSIANWNYIMKAGYRNGDSSWVAEGMTAIGNMLMSRSRALLGMHRPQDAIAAAYAGRDTVAKLSQLLPSVANLYALADVQDSVASIAHKAGDGDAEDTAYAREFAIDSAIAYRTGASIPQIKHFHFSLDQLANRALFSLSGDTAGKDSAVRAARMMNAARVVQRYRERQVHVSRYLFNQSMTHARSRADSARVTAVEGDSLAIDLGNLAWQDLLIGNGQGALLHAREALRLSSKQSYILVNAFNAMALSGLPDEARSFYSEHARNMVETDPQTPFPCAIERDMAVLSVRGVATVAQHAFVRDLSAADRARCPR